MNSETIVRKENRHVHTARSAGTIMVAFVIANLVGLIRQVIINRTFGASSVLDAYFAAFRVPDLLFHVIAGGALGSAFIPTFTTLLARDNQKEAWRLASAVVNWVFIVSAVFAGISGLYAPWLTQQFLAPGFSDEQVAIVVTLMRVMLGSTVIFGASGLLMGIHHSHQHFFSPALAPILYNAGITAGAILLTPKWGVYGLAYGVLAGAFLHLAIQIPRLVRYSGKYSLTLGIHNQFVKTVGRLMLPRTIGLSIWQFNFWINTMICSGLPPGSLSALVIAFQIFTFPQAAIAQAIATAVFPTFSKQVALGHMDRMRQSLSSSLRGALYLSIPASAGLYMIGRPIIEILFQNNTFSASATKMVVWALNWYAIGLVSHSVVEIVTRAYYAMKDTRTPMIVGGLSMILNVILSIVLANSFLTNNFYPHGGLALANTIATTAEMLALLWILGPRLRGLRIASVLKSVLRTIFGTIAMLIFLYIWLQIVTIPAIVTVLGGITMGIAIFWGVTAACGSEEANKIPMLIARQIKELGL